MMLSAEALEIINYLKTAEGKFFSLSEISRRAGGRRRFEESPGWAKGLVGPLLEAGLIEVNPRGHYRVPPKTQNPAHPPAKAPLVAAKKPRKVIGDDYFPDCPEPRIVAGDYFPPTD